jgi:predicted patatin/cPLA2 family phospholipase
MTQPGFIDRRGLLRAKSVVDLEWLWNVFAEREPLDVAALVRCETEFVVVATAAAKGEPAYLRPGTDDMLEALKGSCALPILYRNTIHVGGVRLVDGGISDPIPVEEAYRRGAREILVVRSRPASDASSDRWSSRLLAFLHRREPALARALLLMPERYEASRRFLARPPRDCRIVHVAPLRRLATGRTTQDLRTLEHDYALGVEAGHDAVDRWTATSRGVTDTP